MQEAGQSPQQPQDAVARSAASPAAVDPGPIVGGVLGGLIAVCSSEWEVSQLAPLCQSVV